ncbi:Protein_kinase [Hexamita inflata]|uniref:Putative n=1 Tax=Hexamita inflata TaxID=28002 RepID=A0AA86QFJ3_9EUKA|nr:Protein kinase [Hexamita inflata]
MGCGESKKEDTDMVGENVMDFFDRFDTDAEGYLNPDKLFEKLKVEGFKVSKPMFDAYIALIDENKDGKIQKSEFKPIMGFIISCPSDDVIFKVADKNKDGKIDRKELTLLSKRLGWKFDESIESMTKDEFKAFVDKNLKK